MNRITALADELSVYVVLYPEPSRMEQLKEYFERFGFIMASGDGMTYKPAEPENDS